ncbi:MAG: ribosome maturation factor RimM, partial [Halanaerobiales bacterium]
MDNKLITIGKIGKNQGNKGEVRVIPLTDFPERYTVIEQVYLDNGETVTTRKIEDVWFHKNYVIIKFAGID